MNGVDVLVLIVLAVYTLAGYRTGLVSGALSIGGFVAGAVLGAKFAPTLSASLTTGAARYPLALAVLALGAVLGQFVGAWLAVRLRTRLTWTPVRAADSALGAVLSGLGVLFVVWMVALPLASSPVPALSREVRESRVVHAVDAAVPDRVRSAYSTVRALAGRNGFPEVLGSLQPTHIFDVAPPDSSAMTSSVLARARASIVKVRATGGCGQGSEGSGFVYAAGRVMTNAHVVAGMKAVSVQAGNARVAARVVLFDSARDVAVLAVPPTVAAPLAFTSKPASSTSSAVVAGYPEDGPFAAAPARVRDREHITGYTIYGRSGGARITREIYSIRGTVRPGNSGGPLLGATGKVLGVVFARALDSSNTGFALTAAEVSADVRTGRSASVPVSTGACLSE